MLCCESVDNNLHISLKTMVEKKDIRIINSRFHFLPLFIKILTVPSFCVQVREVTTQLCQPLTSCHGSPGPDATSIPSSFTLSEKQKVEAEVEETCDTSQGNAEGKSEMSRRKTWANQSSIYHKSI